MGRTRSSCQPPRRPHAHHRGDEDRTDRGLHLRGGRPGGAARRRGAGPGRRHRPVPHRPDRADVAAAGDVPARARPRGRRRGRGRSAPDVDGHRGRRPRRDEPALVPQLRRSATAAAIGYCESSLLLNYMGMRMDGSTTYSREGTPVFGNFFGQSSFSRHAIAYADNVVVVDPALDLTRIAPYGCGFQTGAGAVLNVLQPGPRRLAGGVRRRGRRARRDRRGGRQPVSAPSSRSTCCPARLELARRYGAVGINPAELGEHLARGRGQGGHRRWLDPRDRHHRGAERARPGRPGARRRAASSSCSASAPRSSRSTRST